MINMLEGMELIMSLLLLVGVKIVGNLIGLVEIHGDRSGENLDFLEWQRGSIYWELRVIVYGVYLLKQNPIL